MKKVAVIGVALLFGGCTVQTVVPPTTEYRLEPRTAGKYSEAQGCKEQSLKVARLHAPDHFIVPAIYYAQGELKQYAYAYARWAQPLNERIGQLFAAELKKSGNFAHVLSYKTTVGSDFVLQISLNDFMQYYREDGSSVIGLDLELLLLDAKAISIIDRLHIVAEEATQQSSLEGGITAMNRLLEKALMQATAWVGGRCE